ncbi:MAG: ATP-grasp domain-containing protein [Kofleriaceae bacterium]|nr:ATP-grasp domain-containing protein [Kofleriaceae bacterium]MCB9572103.1 ATP-grasp domain-containing protein [Kofleriaceae bacterium]
MLVLARPSISPYLAKTLFELDEPAVLAEEMPVPMRPALRLEPAQTLLDRPKLAYQSLILTSSENALAFLQHAIPHDDRVLKARLFKDKVAFRRALTKLYPEFTFVESTIGDVGDLDPARLRFPLVLKPAAGISSIGVRRVERAADWAAAVAFLRDDLGRYAANHEAIVVDAHKVIVEEWIPGTELAVDCYFDSAAEPVILNVMEHMFRDAEDTSDLVYYTRRSLVRRHYAQIHEFLVRLGDLFDLKRFPMHVELRLTPHGQLVPIEVNPLRFAGQGTTELAEYAYAINVYKHFLRETRPDWDAILAGPDDSVYSFLCVDVPTAQFRAPGLRIHDRALFKSFGEVLEYRMLDEEETSTFAVIFLRADDLDENRRILAMDPAAFVKVTPPA